MVKRVCNSMAKCVTYSPLRARIRAGASQDDLSSLKDGCSIDHHEKEIAA